jgi:diaminohydroxyphosphoribosylaminopyrimidine deaminase/5-amino-6-(5-phosphoribosylamino)uracil reductase
MAKRTDKTASERFMRAALGLAVQGKGSTYPNPAVGAIVVKHGRIVGCGYHRRWGLPHAEVEAIRDAGSASRGADLYVTLEPCSHYGKTPPCTDAVVRSGIRRVFASMLDPNPLVNGKGITALRRAGIAVQVGLLADRSARLNEAYDKFMRTGRPFVTMKVAQTLDGRIAAAGGNARWITSAPAREVARRMRSEAQALVVGAGTALQDDPLLLSKPKRRRNYYRCILDAHLALPVTSRIVRTAIQYPVIVYCGDGRGRKAGKLSWRRRGLERSGVTVVPVASGTDGLLDLGQVIDDLASRRVMHVWVEGGREVFTSFLKRRAVDKIVAFIAPKVMGGGGSLAAVGDIGVGEPDQCLAFVPETLCFAGNDLIITMYPQYPGGEEREDVQRHSR